MKSGLKHVKAETGRIGLISDTHGLVRPEALAALKGSDVIVHAGDIGKPAVIEALESIAPVFAVRGNNDRGAWAKKIPEVLDLTINGVKMRVIHDVNEAAPDSFAGLAAVISGHSHKPGVAITAGVHFINPGSAGPRRFKLPVTVARLRLCDAKLRARILILDV